MEKIEAAMALEDELIQIADHAERIQCMLDDIMECYLCTFPQAGNREEYRRACIRIDVAREAAGKAREELNKLLTTC